MKISGKNIWLVGASTGIGLELARSFAEMGNFVYVTARTRSKLEALERDFPNAIHLLDGDITNRDDLDRIKADLHGHTDVLDMLVLCAGTCLYDDGPTLEIELYRKTFELNYFAHINCTRIALPILKRSGGTVVGVSSLASVVPFPRAEAYGSSKAAFEYLLMSLKIDLADQGVDVVIVRPGFVDTPLTQRNDFAMPFLCDSKTAAQKIIRGLEEEKAIISFPWQMKWILGFFSRFQSLWQNKVATNFKKTQDI